MAWLGTVLSVAGPILSVVGHLSSAAEARRQGKQVAAARAYEAAQLEQNAGQERAAAQRRALEQRRRAMLVASRAQALAAASGGDVSDVTVEKIISDIAGEGEYRALLELYEGEERARRMQMGADVARLEGETAGIAAKGRAKGEIIRAGRALISGGVSLYEKYGRGGPSAADVEGLPESRMGVP